MAIKSNIQWTDATWNIARGCTKVDEDCKFCYMYRVTVEILKNFRHTCKLGSFPKVAGNVVRIAVSLAFIARQFKIYTKYD